MNDEEKQYWLGFSAFPGIGPLRFKLLKEYFGSAQKAWNAPEANLRAIGLGDRLTAKFCSFRKNFSFDEYRTKLLSKNIQTVTLDDAYYPELLSHISDPPFVLYILGDLKRDWKLTHTIAVVGTRKVTGYGEQVTQRITEGLVDAGLTVVSGMAYGVDTVAHQTAIDHGGCTVAVLGCGVDIIHPKSNTTLYWSIVKKYGLVVSEYPPGTYAEKGLFPARNRIISGLSLGTVVTEGASDSGALITARFAADQGREVFAVPGPITSSLSQGPIELLKHGAKIVTDAKDILEELKIVNNPIIRSSNKLIIEKIKDVSKDERKILEILKNENLHFDEIARKSRTPISRVGSILTMMEMKGLVKNLGGGVYGIIS